MAKPFVKVPIKRLRELGQDERWLQARILEDPSILGFGNLAVVERERSMIGGGRLDLLLADIGGKSRYEVEVMLGELDPSHIIRTIEYWDVERRRFPALNHKAVIVAEDITSRFLNVLALLNKSIPLIALQMAALDLPDGIGLTFTPVLDLTETFDEDDQGDESATRVTRADWESEGYGDALPVLDRLMVLLRPGIEMRCTYNQDHIAVGATGSNFMWCMPAKRNGRCMCEFKVGKESIESWAGRITPILGEVTRKRDTTIKFNLTLELLEQHLGLVTELVTHCEKLAR